jgi:hypothetical protein
MGRASVVFVSGSDRMLVTFIFGLGWLVTIELPIFFYQKWVQALPHLGLGRRVTPSAYTLKTLCYSK